ncbi:cytosolic sulfotransferase 5-like [Triticum dicoccoides]|uniref:cytosolic sulfotransferase 5-like n=1 Tax=Triticum dicoccoides TaxID=85692 RepID=UPI000E791BC2|nr:cytosolic sulfotransferase 5-like [Triticum dicoccoides]
MECIPLGSEESAKKGPPENVSSESLEDFIRTLPTREGWSQPMVLYKNYWCRPHLIGKIMQLQDSFKPRYKDIILATQPKCGTTWLKALAFTITNRSRYSFTDHPLLTSNPQYLVPFIEIPDNGRDHTYLETLPSPRLLSTHMPLSMLPPETSSHGCRLVYLCREPKDALVSRWHFENRIVEGSNIELVKAFDMFCEGFSPSGPFWNHCLEYWKESLARPNEVLFLKYEEIKSHPEQVVRQLAKFLGVPLTEEEESSSVAEKMVKLCSFENLTSLKVNQTGGVDHGNKIYVENSVFFRKGKVGDWANHMSEEMAEKLDHVVEQMLKGSGLAF